jgi:hypothetical protein
MLRCRPACLSADLTLARLRRAASWGLGGASQNGQGITVGQVVECLQRCWVVLAQGRAQRIGMAGTGPDQVLMSSGQDLDRLGLSTVARQRAVIVPIGADQIGEQLGVTGIGFRARDLMAVAVAGHGQRVDRIHLIPGRTEGRGARCAWWSLGCGETACGDRGQREFDGNVVHRRVQSARRCLVRHTD